jgi:hypothetical protein
VGQLLYRARGKSHHYVYHGVRTKRRLRRFLYKPCTLGKLMRNDTKAFYSIGKEELIIEEIKGAVPVKAGTCFKCGYGSWTMKTVNHQIIRTCKREGCGAEQPPVD